MRNALISVYNKDGIVEFVRGLVNIGFTIWASGGTARVLRKAKIPVTDTAVLTGREAILNHKVVTLSGEIHGGLLVDPNDDGEMEELKELNVPVIDLVCCDLYPLEQEIAKPDATRESVIKETDIGGPTMLSSGAKGRRIVICDPEDRGTVLEWIKDGEPDRERILDALAAKADFLVSRYRLLSAEYHSNGAFAGFFGALERNCKYGENAWQTPARMYSTPGVNEVDPLALGNFETVAGSPLSYNNLCDLDRGLATINKIAAGLERNYGRSFLIAVGIKHGNVCGAAYETEDSLNAVARMIEGHPRAIFGGTVITNFEITELHADIMKIREAGTGTKRIFDVVVAPSFTDSAVKTLERKGDRCKMLENEALFRIGEEMMDTNDRFRYVRGGFLKQPNYTHILEVDKLQKHYGEPASPPGFKGGDVVLAWAIGATSNSNTITIVKDGKMLANGVGQMDRVGAAKLATSIAREMGHDMKGAVAYSDSFFPFEDAIQVLVDNGIKTILTSSGSIRDEKIIDFCKLLGLILLMGPDTEIRGFYAH